MCFKSLSQRSLLRVSCAGYRHSRHHLAVNTLFHRSTSSDASVSKIPFIERAKLHGPQSLLGRYPSTNGFDACLESMDVVEMNTDGVAVCELEVTESLRNSYGTLHGGAISMLVDVLGTLALLSHHHNNGTKPGVSVEMSTSFLAAAKVGEQLRCTGRVTRMGKTLGFTEVEIRTKENEKLIATGKHTKFFT